MSIKRWLLAAALTVYAVPAAAQLQYHTAVNMATSYTSRGLTWTNRLVVQPSIEFTTGGGTAQATFGVWANVEPGSYNGSRDLSAASGTPGATEYDVTLEAARSFGRLQLGLGTIAFVYPLRQGVAWSTNTIELTARASLDAPLSPTVMVYYDAIAAPGIYAQLSVAHAFDGPQPVHLRGAIGYSHGQADEHDPAAYYAADGLTHVEGGAEVPLVIGGLSIVPLAKAVIAIDDAVRIMGPVQRRVTKLIVGARLGFSGTPE